MIDRLVAGDGGGGHLNVAPFLVQDAFLLRHALPP